MKKLIFLSLLVVLVIGGCRKDGIDTDFEFTPDDDGQPVDTRLGGQVIDKDGLPIAAAIITIGNETIETNDDGIFYVRNINLSSNGSLVVIEKSGYFTNFKRVTPNGNDTYQKFGLTKVGAPSGKFSATEGGTISRQGKEKIVFQANSIVDESGNDYSGEVTVYTDYFNLDKPHLGELMPGDLTGINQEATKVQLETYSMIMVELQGSNGQELNLKEGTTASAEFPISQQTANPPAEIPLWSLNEDTGLWVEEGIATLEGGVYKAELPHFSFWNCDVPYPLVNLKGRITDLSGTPYSNLQVNISIKDGGITRGGSTNDNGEFEGKVPANEDLVLELVNICEDVIHSEDIGPFTNDTVLPDIQVDLGQNTMLLTGSLINCDGGAVEDGLVVVKDQTGRVSSHRANMDGTFEVIYVYCDAATDIEVKGTDITNLTESTPYTFSNTGQSTEDVGILTTCDNLDEFLKVTYQGQSYLFVTTFSMLIDDTYLLTANEGLNNATTGSVSINNVELGQNFPQAIHFRGAGFPEKIGCTDITPGDDCRTNYTVNILENPPSLGGYWSGTGSGNLWMNSQLIPVEIEFREKLDEKFTRIKGNFWYDANGNGLRESDELPVENAEIEFSTVNNLGTQSTNRFTDPDGSYTLHIPSSLAGTLSVLQIPSGFSITQKDVGDDDSIDSDIDPITGTLTNVKPDPDNTIYFDCGLIEN